LATAVHLKADTIISENFDELTPTLNVTSAGVFTATSGNVDVVGSINGNLFASLCAAPESGNCVDLDGSTQGAIQLTSPLTLQPGVNYFLSFDLIGSQRGNSTSTTVTFGSYSNTFILPSGDVTDGIVVNQLVTVAVATPTNLVFTSNTPGAQGALLDDVSITSSSSSTPEPATAGFVMMALGAGAFWLKRRS
jgi:hypothetical protein